MTYLRPLILAGALLVSACSGSVSDNASTPAVVTTSSTASSTSTRSSTSTTFTNESTTSVETPDTTTTLQASSSLVISPSDVPALVDEWGDGTGDPYDLARRIIGFPVEIGTPAGSAPLDMSVELKVRDEGASGSWAWSYGTSSTVGEIDSDLPDGGPGMNQLLEFYDPILVSLGWHKGAQVISNPSSSADGPRSGNFAYKPDFDALSVAGIDATPGVVRVWAFEDLDFKPGPALPGYRVDLSAVMVSGFVPAAIPALFVDRLPEVPGATLSKVRFRSLTQVGDSYNADTYGYKKGDRYLEIEIGLDLPVNSTDLARDAYSTGLDGSTYQMGQPSSTRQGVVQMMSASTYADTWTQWVVVLGRYVGTIEIVTDPETGAAVATIRIRLEPHREVLSPA